MQVATPRSGKLLKKSSPTRIPPTRVFYRRGPNAAGLGASLLRGGNCRHFTTRASLLSEPVKHAYGGLLLFLRPLFMTRTRTVCPKKKTGMARYYRLRVYVHTNGYSRNEGEKAIPRRFVVGYRGVVSARVFLPINFLNLRKTTRFENGTWTSVKETEGKQIRVSLLDTVARPSMCSFVYGALCKVVRLRPGAFPPTPAFPV